MPQGEATGKARAATLATTMATDDLPAGDTTADDVVPSSTLGRMLATAGAASGPFVDSVGSAIGAALDSIRESAGRRVRRIRRMSHEPLPSLPDLYPEARRARPVEIGFRTLDVADIRGTAVGGGDQRGADFLPFRAFRSKNWSARWQRLRKAHDRLADLPPIDVVKYDGSYWIVDGHNRVGLALYVGQVAIDASVVELVPPGGHRTEPIGSLAAEVESSRMVRGRVDSEAASDDGQPLAGGAGGAGSGS